MTSLIDGLGTVAAVPNIEQVKPLSFVADYVAEAAAATTPEALKMVDENNESMHALIMSVVTWANKAIIELKKKVSCCLFAWRRGRVRAFVAGAARRCEAAPSKKSWETDWNATLKSKKAVPGSSASRPALAWRVRRQWRY